MTSHHARVRALYRNPYDGHECNVYCAPETGIHADLVYSEERGTEQSVNAAYTWTYWVRVVSVEPATEAPPIAAIPPEYRDVITASTRRPEEADQRRWIVRWQDDQQIWSETA